MSQQEIQIHKSLMDGSLLKSVTDQIIEYKKQKLENKLSSSDHIASLSQVFKLPEKKVEKLADGVIVSQYQVLTIRDKFYTTLTSRSKEFILLFLVSIIFSLSVYIVPKGIEQIKSNRNNNAEITIPDHVTKEMEVWEMQGKLVDIFSKLNDIKLYQYSYFKKNSKNATEFSELGLEKKHYISSNISNIKLKENGDIVATLAQDLFGIDKHMILTSQYNTTCLTSRTPKPDWCNYKDADDMSVDRMIFSQKNKSICITSHTPTPNWCKYKDEHDLSKLL